jgi:hypothetical protein
MMRIAEKILSTYTDQTLGLKASTFITEAGHFGTRFYKDGVWQIDEIYEGHSEEYAENAAENYVMEIKRL